MSMFSDFFNFVSSFLAGESATSKQFMESLTMSERYLRWGIERKDPRDLRQALVQIENCNDEAAPKADMLLRKYQCKCNATVELIEAMAERQKQKKNHAREETQALGGQKKECEALLERLRKQHKELEAEGSLIRAKEMAKEIHDEEVRLASIEKKLQGGGKSAEMATDYDKLVHESEHLCRGLEDSIVALEAMPEVPDEVLGKVREQILTRLEAVRTMVQQLRPEPEEVSPDIASS